MKQINEPSLSYRVGGTYLVDGLAREVVRGNERIHLTPSEFAMFHQLVQNQGATVPREELSPWKGKSYSGRHPAEDARKEIKKKVGPIIETVRAVGYRISPAFAIEIIPPPSATELQQLLVVTLAQMDTHSYAGFKAAMENCEQLIAAGKVPDAYCAKALAHINLGMVGYCRELPAVSIDATRDLIERALKWYPKLGSAYALRGLTYLIQYKWIEAENDLNKSLEFDQNNDFGHSFLSHLLVARRKFDEALDHARLAVKADYKQPIICITEPWFMLF